MRNLKPLIETGERIADQDNRCTDQPMFVVFQKSTLVVAEDYDHDRIVWVNEDGNEADHATATQLDAMHDDVSGNHFMEDEIELGDGVRTEWRRIAIKEIDEFVTACFTEQGCKDFLAIQGHNLRRPFIYAAGSFRNREFQSLRTLMLNLYQETATADAEVPA